MRTGGTDRSDREAQRNPKRLNPYSHQLSGESFTDSQQWSPSFKSGYFLPLFLPIYPSPCSLPLSNRLFPFFFFVGLLCGALGRLALRYSCQVEPPHTSNASNPGLERSCCIRYYCVSDVNRRQSLSFICSLRPLSFFSMFFQRVLGNCGVSRLSMHRKLLSKGD